MYHPKKSKLGGVKCVICEEAVGSFLQYKCHLYAHFEEVRQTRGGREMNLFSGPIRLHPGLFFFSAHHQGLGCKI